MSTHARASVIWRLHPFVQFASSNPSSCLPVVTLIRDSQNWAVTHIEILNELDPADAASVATWWAGYITAKRLNLPLPEPAEWSNMAEALRTVAICNRCGFDMKAENAMKRPDGTIVFTDPLF
jgi:hypothetical protein